MKITADQIATVHNFIHKNEEMERDHLKVFPEASLLIKRLVGATFEVRFSNHYNDRHISLFGTDLYFDVYRISGHHGHKDNPKPTGFLWEISFNKWINDTEVPLKLDRVVKLMPLINTINDHREQIEEIITGLLPACDEYTDFSQLVDSAKWSFDRVEKFFGCFVPVDSEEIETEDGLKELRNTKMENWNNSIWKHSDGKNETIKFYREKLFPDFIKNYNQIISLNG
jgi:hypothetical protein